MKLEVLGCSGGIGGELRTTAFLVDDDILVDGGTGVTSLSIEALAKIDHVFITHCHLDHIASIPLMVDSVARMRDKPLTLYGSEAIISILRGHIFNWEIWPDFTRIPNVKTPFMQYRIIQTGKPVTLGNRVITALPAEHVVPAVGYHLESSVGSLVFSGDTTTNDALWYYVNNISNLRYIIVETAFSNTEKDIAILSKHLCPSILADELKKLKQQAEIYITHLKPGEAEQTMREIRECVVDRETHMLENGQIFEF